MPKYPKNTYAQRPNIPEKTDETKQQTKVEAPSPSPTNGTTASKQPSPQPAKITVEKNENQKTQQSTEKSEKSEKSSSKMDQSPSQKTEKTENVDKTQKVDQFQSGKSDKFESPKNEYSRSEKEFVKEEPKKIDETSKKIESTKKTDETFKKTEIIKKEEPVKAQSPKKEIPKKPESPKKETKTEMSPKATTDEMSGVADPGAPNKDAVKVLFKVNYKVEFGECLCVVGSSTELGEWNIEKKTKLTWTEGNDWKAIVYVYPGKDIEFKYLVTKTEGGAVVRWEEGNNHKLSTSYTKSLTVSEGWGQAK